MENLKVKDPQGELSMEFLVGIAEGWIEPESEEQLIKAWQHLHDTGIAYKLQGWFGRAAKHLIKEGIINE